MKNRLSIYIFQNKITDRKIPEKIMSLLVDFKALNGWLKRFLNSQNIVSRSITSIGQKIPDDVQKLCDFFLSLRYC